MQAHTSTPLKNTVWRCLTGLVVCCVLVLTPLQSKEPVKEGAHSEEAKKDLKALHTAMTRYLEANQGVWPQEPDDILGTQDEAPYWNWWMTLLKKHGATDEDFKLSMDTSERPMSYNPTAFDDTPMQAYLWRNQPWFILLVPLKPAYLINAEGKPMRVKELSELQPVPGQPNAYIDPEMQGDCPIEAVPSKLRPLFETALKAHKEIWKDKQ